VRLEPRAQSLEPRADCLLAGGRMVTDPVCKMQIDEKKAAGTTEYKGTTYYFCALSCKTRFDQDPEKFSKQQ
jgi:YHS domain-containing protein